MNALTEEAVLPTLHNLILAEVYLSGGPVDVFRLWSEMYERQKTIDVGTLLFVRAIAHLEENGFLQKVSESKSAITGKGEAYLGLAESGLKLASTANILDVAPELSTTTGGIRGKEDGACVECIPSSPGSFLDVADRATGNAPVTDGLQVGDEGVSDCGELLRMEQSAAGTVLLGAGINTHPLRNEQSSDSQILDRHGDDRFADNIQRALEGLPQNGDAEEELAAAEEGAAIEASNLPYPEYERNGR